MYSNKRFLIHTLFLKTVHKYFDKKILNMYEKPKIFYVSLVKIVVLTP